MPQLEHPVFEIKMKTVTVRARAESESKLAESVLIKWVLSAPEAKKLFSQIYQLPNPKI